MQKQTELKNKTTQETIAFDAKRVKQPCRDLDLRTFTVSDQETVIILLFDRRLNKHAHKFKVKENR